MPAASDAIAVNTGPLIALAACDALDFLRRLHSHVLVPTAVIEEFERGRAGASRSPLPSWFDVRTLSVPMPAILIAHLDHTLELPQYPAVVSVKWWKSSARHHPA